MREVKYSVVIPVYNRPQEVDELLQSLVTQTYTNFEVVIIEDGSTIRCDTVVDRYRDSLAITYFYKPNTGPGPSRNVGFSMANGVYFVVFDSDCILPSTYFESVEKALHEHSWDAWGGPDQAHKKFTTVQRAMGYSMSSVFTTGGIRGGKKHVGWFQPRSFNMGISKKVFQQTNGFAFDRLAEDIEFSIRMKKAGFSIGLINDAFVFHKRRTSLSQFYHQVFGFGQGRVRVARVHPEAIKLTHWFPSLFTMGLISLLILPFISVPLFFLGFSLTLLYWLIIAVHSYLVTKSIAVACLSVPAAVLQLVGYGLGFLSEKLSLKQ